MTGASSSSFAASADGPRSGPRPAAVEAALPLRLAAVAPLLLLAALLCIGAPWLAGAEARRAAEAAGARAGEAAARLAAEAAAGAAELAGYAALLEAQAPRRAAEVMPALADAARRIGRLHGLVLLDAGGLPVVAPGRPAQPVLAAPLLPRPGTGPTTAVIAGEAWLLLAADAPGHAWVLAARLDRRRLAAPAPLRLGLMAAGGLIHFNGEGLGQRPALGPATPGRGPGLLAEGEAFRAVAGAGGLQAVAELPADPILAEVAWRRRAVLAGGGAVALLLLSGAAALHGRLRPRAAPTPPPAAAPGEIGPGVLQALPVTIYRGELFPDLSFLSSAMGGNVEALTGCTWQALSVPGAWRRRLDAEGRETLDAFYRRLLEEGEAVADYAFCRPDGRTVWLRDHARIIRMGAHNYAEVAGCLADISAERQLGEQAAAAAKLGTLGRLATSLAHELSQPLGAILLAAENGLAALDQPRQPDPEATGRRLRRIAEQAGRARQLVDHLRAFGRADAGALEAVPVAAALDGALMLVGQPLEMAGVDLRIAMPPDLPPVRARRVLLEQVLVNLMLNARDAMLQRPDAERRLVVTAEAGPRPGLVTLRVADTGPGLSPEVLARLFEPFFTTKPLGQGSGLGLWICHGILASFGGGIAARNAVPPGCGAVFELTLRDASPEAGPAPPGMATMPTGQRHHEQRVMT